MFIVVKKVKDLIKGNNGFCTSAGAITVLSELVEEIVAVAIINAQEDGRKTVMNRDIEKAIQQNQKGETSEKFN